MTVKIIRGKNENAVDCLCDPDCIRAVCDLDDNRSKAVVFWEKNQFSPLPDFEEEKAKEDPNRRLWLSSWWRGKE